MLLRGARTAGGRDRGPAKANEGRQHWRRRVVREPSERVGMGL
jgi:hypothetical protein